jgi:hypothetical protein
VVGYLVGCRQEHRVEGGKVVTIRHRYVGRGDEPCKEAFGGVARCAMPRLRDLHWHDLDHPFKPGGNLGRCGWRLQDASVEGQECGLGREDEAHVGVGDAEARTEYPAAQPEVITQQYGYPPDEDSVAAAPPPAPPSQVADAVASLRGDGAVYSGPWPVRRYRLADRGWVLQSPEGKDTDDDGWQLASLLSALDELGEVYVVDVIRPFGQAWRWAMVTWGDMKGCVASELADAIAQDYRD